MGAVSNDFVLGCVETFNDNAALAVLPAGVPFAPFVFSDLSFGAAAAGLKGMRGEFAPSRREPFQLASFASAIGAGVCWFWGNCVVRTRSFWAAVSNFTGAANGL